MKNINAFLLKFYILFLILFLMCQSIRIRHNIKTKENTLLKKLNVASIALANLFKRLGSTHSIEVLSMRIDLKCSKGILMNKWLRIIKLYSKMIKQSTKYPFYLKRYWNLNRHNRIKMFREFIESFVKCGGNNRASTPLMKLANAYRLIQNVSTFKLVKFVQQLKRIFFRKRFIRNRRDNTTIYKYDLLLKIINFRKNVGKCVHSRKLCVFYAYRCGVFRSVCKNVKNLRDKIIYKIRKTFSFYYSVVFANLINLINSPDFKRNPHIRKL